jgi:hypothetical protein
MRCGFFSLAVLSLSLGATAFAQAPLTESECPNIDFSSQLGPALGKGNSNMCHAFVAADLITVNQKIGPKHRVSALDVGSNVTVADPAEVYRLLPPARSLSELAIRQKSVEEFKLVQGVQFDTSTDMRGGMPDLDIVAYNLRKSICTEKDLPSMQSDVFEHSWDYLYGRVRDSTGKWNRGLTAWRELNECAVKNSMDDFAEFAVAFSHALQRESDQTLHNACVHPLPLKPMVAHSLNLGEGVAARLAIQHFKQGAPVGVGYDHGILSGGKADRTESDHASTISASHWNEKTHICEFKLRNTRGPSCDHYRKDWKCIRGELWLPASDLDQMTTMMFYIDP